MTTSVSIHGEPDREAPAVDPECPPEGELPARPVAVRVAVAATGLIAVVLGGLAPVFTPVAADARLSTTPVDVLTAAGLSAVLAGPVVVTAVQLWRGSTLAYATAVAVSGLAVTGVVALYALRIYFDLSFGASVSAGLTKIATSTTGAACTVVAVLALVVQICLRTPASQAWAAHTHGHRFDRR